jgi:RsiW-degrading membrane proteinase PrsW (M82 family)
MALFCLGMISCFIVVKVSDLLGIILPFMSKPTNEFTFLDTILYAFIGVAFIEEFCKWLVTYFIGYKNKEFDETYDIIVYSIFTALGFATFENIQFVMEQSSLLLAVQRAIFSVPGHVAFAIFMSYYLCKAKISKLQGNKKEERNNIIKSIVIPTLAHAIFDFCLFADKDIYLIIFYSFSIVLFLLAFEKLKILYKNNASLITIKRSRQ